MKLSKTVGLLLSIAAVTLAGCCCRPDEEVIETPVFDLQDYVIKIVEHPDLTVTDVDGNDVPICWPQAEKLIEPPLRPGDTVTFVNEYLYDAKVFMSPGPFNELVSTFEVKMGEEIKLTVGDHVEDYFYQFRLSCDTRGPGPGMQGDDPDEN